jgi:hypothetical protein
MIPVNRSSFGRAGGRLRRYPGGTEKRQHLGHRPRVNPKTPRRLPLAHPFDLNRKTNPSVKLHAPCPFPTKAFCCRIFTPMPPAHPQLQ